MWAPCADRVLSSGDRDTDNTFFIEAFTEFRRKDKQTCGDGTGLLRVGTKGVTWTEDQGWASR